MRYSNLGNTGLQVSVMGLGGAAFGNQYGSVEFDEAKECIHQAIDAGINLIDTSPYYGKTRSEKLVGDVLKDGLRSRVILSTKAGRNDFADFDFTPAAITASLDRSLQHLHTDYVDILIAHDIEFAKDYEPIFTETAQALHRLKQSGKCRFIGMSGLPLKLLREAIERCNLDVVMSYSHYTLQNQSLATELLPTAAKHQVGVMNASPLCLGLLTHQGPPPWHPGSTQLKQTAREVVQWCEANGKDLAFLGMQYAFTAPQVASTITGTAKASELKRNLQALETPIDPDLLANVQKMFAPVMNQTWE